MDTSEDGGRQAEDGGFSGLAYPEVLAADWLAGCGMISEGLCRSTFGWLQISSKRPLDDSERERRAELSVPLQCTCALWKAGEGSFEGATGSFPKNMGFKRGNSSISRSCSQG